MVVAWWLSELAYDRGVLGSIPATSKLFSGALIKNLFGVSRQRKKMTLATLL